MSSEDFKSLIVTDPDLIDEGIDVSGLRTQTDTNPRLLGAIEDYPGISYDPTSYSYLSDLNRLFASGLPTIDTSQPTTPAPPSGGGGGGGGTSPGTGGEEPPNTGIGPQFGDPDYADPGVDAEENQPYFEAIDTSGITSDPIEIENISSNPYDIPMDVDDPGASIENLIAQNPSGTIPGRPDIFDINQTGDPSQNPSSTNVGDQPMAAGPFDYLQPISTIANPEIFDSYAGVNDPQIGDPGFTGYTPSFDTPEQENTVQNIFGKVGQTVEGALTELGKIPGAIVDATNKTVDVFGKKLNVGKTLASIAINKAVGAPVTLVFDILKDIMPEQAIQTSIVDELKAEKDYGFNIQSGNLNQDPFGRNPVSGFGDYEGTLAEDAVSTSTTKMGLAKKEFAQDYFNKKAEYAGGVEVDEGTVLGPGEAPGDVVSLDDMLREQRDEKIDEGIQAADDDKGSDIDTFDTTPADTTNIVDEVALTGGKDKDDKPAPPAPPSPPTDTGGGGGGGGGADMGTAPKGGTYDAEAEDDQYESPTPTQDFYQDPITTGGGGNQGNPGGSTGGCCFIMLESRYGDGTMDKVVRRYRDEKMTPRNRRGYYKVARVLVPLMRKSKVFKWIVAKTFADPLVSYGKWYYGENKHGWIFAPIKTAWLKIFDVVGTDTVFIRENGEEV